MLPPWGASIELTQEGNWRTRDRSGRLDTEDDNAARLGQPSAQFAPQTVRTVFVRGERRFGLCQDRNCIPGIS